MTLQRPQIACTVLATAALLAACAEIEPHDPGPAVAATNERAPDDASSGVQAARPVPLGRFDVTWVDGEAVITPVPADGNAASGSLRTVPQAAWCLGTLPPFGEREDGVAYTWQKVPGSDVDEHPTETTNACASDGSDFPLRARGAVCYEHGIISRSNSTMHHVTLVIERMIPGGHALLDAPEVPPELEGLDLTGMPPMTLGALYYGTLEPGGAYYQRLSVSNSDNAGVWFGYGVYAIIDEACNGVDDDCDGEVDEDGACE